MHASTATRRNVPAQLHTEDAQDRFLATCEADGRLDIAVDRLLDVLNDPAAPDPGSPPR